MNSENLPLYMRDSNGITQVGNLTSKGALLLYTAGLVEASEGKTVLRTQNLAQGPKLQNPRELPATEVESLIRKHLGLLPRNEFVEEYNRIDKSTWDPDDIISGRRSGKTTEVLIRALVVAYHEGKTAYLSSRYSKSDADLLLRSASKYSHKLDEIFPPLPKEALLLLPEKKGFRIDYRTSDLFQDYDSVLSSPVSHVTLGGLVDTPNITDLTVSAKFWFEQIAHRREKGHELVLTDDVFSRKVGFTDHTTHQGFYLGLTDLKTATNDDFAPMLAFGHTAEEVRELMCTVPGRNSLLGADDFWYSPEDSEPESSEQEVPPPLGSKEEVLAQVFETLSKEPPRLPSLNIEPVPKKIIAPKGWSSLKYPDDSSRAPLLDSKGALIERSFEGIFKRKAQSLFVIPDGGKLFEAQTSSWSLQAEDLDGVSGYVVPAGTSFEDQGLDQSAQIEIANKTSP